MSGRLTALKAAFESEKFIADFLKLLIGGILAAVSLLGYSYAHLLYSTYGVSLNDLGFGSFDYLFRGVFIISDPSLLFKYAAIIIGLCLVAALFWAAHSLLAAPFLGLSLLALVGLSLAEGRRLANQQITLISQGAIGRPIQCKLTDTAAGSPHGSQLASMLDSLGPQTRLRLIATGREFVYLAVALPEERRDDATRLPPQTLVIPRSKILFCRLFGDQLRRS